jgi:amidohydrolase
VEGYLSNGELKMAVCEAIERRKQDIMLFGERIWRTPELGFKEWKTSNLVSRELSALGLKVEQEIAVTGVIAATKQLPGPGIAILGEMDALACPGHPDADPTTGAVHACGHNAQLAAMLGSAIGLLESGVAEKLCGRVLFMAVPAEEYVEIEYRLSLREKGKIYFLGGKQEFIRLRKFEDVDIALAEHLAQDISERKMRVGGSLNGFIGKMVRYRGREAHAGGRPDQGINALNAALLGILAIHTQRETFRDEDHIRVHPIITKGGDMVNIVPSDVKVETYVRGRTVEAIREANIKINRALKAGADAVGAGIEITDIPGYLPMVTDPNLCKIFIQNARSLIGAENVDIDTAHRTGSSDIGDVSNIVPTLYAHVGGTKGDAHSREFRIVDPEMAYVLPAKAIAMTVVDLLSEEAEEAKRIIAKYTPKIQKDGYEEYWDRIIRGPS